jgi:bifunctional DNA-binding transcriptional regulator/antitoxin component of YhaV-PrlF toxin-antitoxin module
MATETFTVKLQAQNRIVIPQANAEILKLKQGDKLRVKIEKVR